jgi:hypothetical protein
VVTSTSLFTLLAAAGTMSYLEAREVRTETHAALVRTARLLALSTNAALYFEDRAAAAQASLRRVYERCIDRRRIRAPAGAACRPDP